MASAEAEDDEIIIQEVLVEVVVPEDEDQQMLPQVASPTQPLHVDVLASQIEAYNESSPSKEETLTEQTN